MILLEDKLISEDVFESHFVCDLERCKGACCIEGDAGAPINQEESAQISEDLERIKQHLSEESQAFISQNGFKESGFTEDEEIQCLEDGKCVFAVQDEGKLSCGIEKAHQNGDSKLLKPMSCHLYPIRISKVGEYTALNYHKWNICAAACKLGKKLNMPLFKFLEKALIKAFGEEFYEQCSQYHEAQKD